MKTLGLIGGMSWESTLPYYRLINEGVKARLGGLHSAKLVLYSVDFAEVEALQRAGQWDEAGQLLAQAARALQAAGAQGLLLCTNTMHKVAYAITSAVDLPLIHIADATAQAVQMAGVRHDAAMLILSIFMSRSSGSHRRRSASSMRSSGRRAVLSRSARWNGAAPALAWGRNAGPSRRVRSS